MFSDVQDWAVVHQEHQDKLAEAARARLAKEALAGRKHGPHPAALLAQPLSSLLRGIGRKPAKPAAAQDAPCSAAGV